MQGPRVAFDPEGVGSIRRFCERIAGPVEQRNRCWLRSSWTTLWTWFRLRKQCCVEIMQGLCRDVLRWQPVQRSA